MLIILKFYHNNAEYVVGISQDDSTYTLELPIDSVTMLCPGGICFDFILIII